MLNQYVLLLSNILILCIVFFGLCIMFLGAFLFCFCFLISAHPPTCFSDRISISVPGSCLFKENLKNKDVAAKLRQAVKQSIGVTNIDQVLEILINIGLLGISIN